MEGVKQVIEISRSNETVLVEEGAVAAARRASYQHESLASAAAAAVASLSGAGVGAGASPPLETTPLTAAINMGAARRRVSHAVSVEQTPFMLLSGAMSEFHLQRDEYLQGVK